MARASSRTKTSLPTAEARRRLPGLVKEMGAKEKPSRNLLEDAVDIGPHRKGGALLIPEVDVVEHERETEQLRSHVEELEEDLESMGLALFVQERLATTSGERLSSEQFLTRIGMEEFIAELPGA